MSQLGFDLPVDKRDSRVVVRLNRRDIQVLEDLMKNSGETSKSSFVRRLIYDQRKREAR